jgi:hypothetical protein
MTVDEGVTQKDALEAFLKDSSLLVYSSAKGVVSGGGVVSSEIGVGEKKDYKRKDKVSDREKGDRVHLSEDKMSSKGKDGEDSRGIGPKTHEESRVIGPRTQEEIEMDMIRDTESVLGLIGPLNKDVITKGSVKKDLEEIIGSFLLFVWLTFFTYALLALVYVSYVEDRFFNTPRL